MARFYHGFFRKLGDDKLSRVKTSQSEDPEEARVRKLGKKGRELEDSALRTSRTFPLLAASPQARTPQT